MELFSKKHGSKKPDVLSYDLPYDLRVQIVQIWEEAFGEDAPHHPGPGMAYREIFRILSRKHAFFVPPNFNDRLPLRGNIANYFLELGDVPKALDVVQIVFCVMEDMLHKKRDMFGDDAFGLSRKFTPEAIQELNEAFKEAGVAYQYVDRTFTTSDSQFTHSEITVPALEVLSQSYLKGANEEFLSAHDHFRHGKFKECINDCLKSFESTMKLICEKRHWPFKPDRDTAGALILVCKTKGLFSPFMDAHLTNLATLSEMVASTLQTGVPNARNKTSGHGQGSNLERVKQEFARYVMNLTAANIRYLAESEQNLK